MRIEQTTMHGCVIVAIHGRLDPGTAPFLQRILLRRLSERPRAVVCDLTGLEAIDVICAAVFSTAARPGRRWPGTQLVVAGARPAVTEVLAQAGVAAAVPAYDTVDQAVEAVTERQVATRLSARG